MSRTLADQHKAEVSRIISKDINAEGFIHDFKYECAPYVFGQSRRTLLVHFTHYQQAEVPKVKVKVSITMTVEEGVTAEQIKNTIEEGDCGDLDKIIDEIEKIKVKVIPEEASLEE